MTENHDDKIRTDKRPIICASIFLLAAAAYFILCAFKSGGDTRVQRYGAASCGQAADNYFRAFGECDGALYASTVSPERYAALLKLFDDEAELYESYIGQFDDERDYFTALYGSDFKVSYEILGRTDISSPEEGESCAAETVRLEVTAQINGAKAHRTDSGLLTIIRTDEGWYVYDSDFKENFW